MPTVIQPDEEEEGAGTAGPEGRAASVIGVLGAGTMGAGIAQLACRSGARTLLFDPIAPALESGQKKVREGLAREVERKRLSAADGDAAAERLEATSELADLAPCELVIEAAPERVELKHELFGSLSEIVSEECVLATNTSSLPVTGKAMGKEVIRASDGPGFLVNRCNRPFGLEALRVLSERLADVSTIDRIVRMEGGYRMGPFELMDLVGIDTGFEVSKSFYELSFGEPRWRPSPITARYAAAGMWGRKSGRGYYSYEGEGTHARAAGTDGPIHRPDDPPPLPPVTPARGEGAIVIAGESALAQQLREAAKAAGYEVRSPHDPTGGVLPALVVECDRVPEARDGGQRTQSATAALPQGGARLILCAQGSLAALDGSGSAVGFHVLPPLQNALLVELTRSEESSPLAAARAERFFTTLGKHFAWVGDSPGLVLGRLVCQVMNECAFALGEGVGSAADIDTGMVLGLNHPRGPLEWADEIGLDVVLGVLDALCDEYREERYRAAPALRRLVRAGRVGRASGAGFFEYGESA